MGDNVLHSHLQREQILSSSQSIVQQWIGSNFGDYLQQLDQHLFDLANKADSNANQTRYFQTREELKLNQQPLEHNYQQHIQQAFKKFHKNRNTASDYSADPTRKIQSENDVQALSLIDNDELEESLAIGNISRKITAKCSEELYALNQRLSVLNGGHKINDRGNPIAPAVLGEALKQIISELQLDNHARILIYKVFESTFMSKAIQLYQQLNKHYSEAQVLPHLSYHIEKNPPVTVANRSVTDSSKMPAENNLSSQLPDELQNLISTATLTRQQQLIQAIRLLQQQLKDHSARSAPTFNVPVEQIISGIQQLQQQANEALQNMDNTAAVKLRLEAEQQLKKQGNIDDNSIEIVGLLFEYMLNDGQLADSVKTLLSYLHTPFLKITLVDKDFFNQPNHPARQLLNSLVAAGERWVDPHSKHKNEVFERIKEIVRRLLSDFDDDIRLFSELAIEFNQYLRQHARRIRLLEKRATQAAEGENKLQEIRLKVKAYLQQKSNGLTLAPTVSTLLFEPWANFLAFNLLRFGSGSDQWRDAAQAVDDVLWFSQPHREDDWHAKKRLQELKQSLPDVLLAGFDTVGYDSNQAKRLLNALLQQTKNTATDTSLVKVPVAQAIDDVKISATKPQADNSDPIMQQLRQTQPGTWFEFDAKTDNPKRVKLAWSNDKTGQFMFVNRMGIQVAQASSAQLLKAISTNKARIINATETAPFFEKAMERV
ncbi:MAG: hypothetical protein ACJAYG_002446, partial [Oceanicoccus sp.]